MEARSDDRREEAACLARETTERFLVVDSADLTKSIATLRSTLSEDIGYHAAAFEQNISSMVSTVGVPVTLASAASKGSHWQRIHSAERIRALKLMLKPGENHDALNARRANQARKAAAKKMKDLSSSSDGRDTLAADACRFLLNALDHPALGEAANELLRQGIVLTWAALELLSKDLFETLLNANPQVALTVLKNSAAKHRLQSKFTLEELAEAGFNLSNSLGSLFASQQDFSDLRTIKSVLLPALDSDPDVNAALSQRMLWNLCQQRHLIVHRRGIVDSRYVAAIGGQATIGERLVVSPDDLEVQIVQVVEAARALLSAASRPAV